MAANAEKPVTFGATIETPSKQTPQKPAPALRSPPSNESDMSAPSVAGAEKNINIDSTNPFSAFYKHPEARRSMDGGKMQPVDSVMHSKSHLDVNVYERDLEAGVPLSTATTQQPKSSVDGRVKECTMWPTHQEMQAKKKMDERARKCNLFRRLNSKQRLWLKIVIGLLIVGLATGLGVGISRAVGGGVWASPGQTKQIPNN